MKAPHSGLRTVRVWACYVPHSGVIKRGYRTKREAKAKRRGREVILQMSGVYLEPEAKS